MPEAVWSALTDPHRRAALELLRQRPRAVGELVDALQLTQPSNVSKHLRVLRDAGLVRAITDQQRRIYVIEPGPFEDLDTWLAPYRALWNGSLDALGRHLDDTLET